MYQNHFIAFLEALKTPQNHNILDTIHEGYNTLFQSLTEARRHYSKKYAEDEDPIKEDDVLTVYHGFNKLDDALVTAKFGLSGKVRARRIYSYESGNNPKGLFVSIDIENIKRGGFSGGVIIEFATKVKDLDAPTWVGGRSYFVQGEYTKSFKDEDERKQQQLANRERASKSDVPAISQSDRPELAETLFQNAEKQALYTGDLNPNMIRAFWVNDTLLKERRIDGSWERISPRQFMKKYYTKENTEEKYVGDQSPRKSDRHNEAEGKMFLPNEDYDEGKIQKWIASRYKNIKPELLKELIEDFMKEIKTPGNRYLDQYLWPKQIEQVKKKYNL